MEDERFTDEELVEIQTALDWFHNEFANDGGLPDLYNKLDRILDKRERRRNALRELIRISEDSGAYEKEDAT